MGVIYRRILCSITQNTRNKMKQNHGKLLLCLLLLLLTVSQSSSRLLKPIINSAMEENDITTPAASSSEHPTTDLSNLMGTEEDECGDEDEECVKRRMIAEAHLDYIYTQHHKPKH